MAREFRGAGGALGVALGRVARLAAERSVETPADEPAEAALARFAAAQRAAAARLADLGAQLRHEGRADEAGIFDAHALLAEDPFLTDEVARLVGEADTPLPAALDATIDRMRAALEALDDPYLRARAADIDAVGQEIRAALAGNRAAPHALPPGSILIAADLTPAQTAGLRGGAVAGFATAYGGPTGHTAILARSLGIPAVVGLGPELLELPEGAPLILDGDAAVLIADPAPHQQAAYARRRDSQRHDQQRREALRNQPGQLRDGLLVSLSANIGSPDEVEAALAAGAEGVGLFRTEFLFLDRAAPPNQEEQYAAYRSVLEQMAGRPVVIRTLDIGGDKTLSYLDLPQEPNPFLGVRGLRLCMRHPDLFATQLRALLRAAPHGNLWIMLPMVATPADLAWGRAQLRAAAEALAAEGLAHRADVPLGAMIETPAAAVTADLLAHEADFFSVGTNDLTQYAMAADRGLGELAQRYPHDAPAVLRLIRQAVEAAGRAGIPIGLCGDLAGVPALAPALVGLGIHKLSLAPALIPLVKEQLREVSQEEAQAAARRLSLEP
ncbi:MAG TPA: phosphoenolpyruvate--protein phosphotransferase [Roseiflexaceae bacterium]|nr:phosphoenolpyruvate--protein phosphotransferase [Roseiflexaceae bacterium]